MPPETAEGVLARDQSPSDGWIDTPAFDLSFFILSPLVGLAAPADLAGERHHRHRDGGRRAHRRTALSRDLFFLLLGRYRRISPTTLDRLFRGAVADRLGGRAGRLAADSGRHRGRHLSLERVSRLAPELRNSLDLPSSRGMLRYAAQVHHQRGDPFHQFCDGARPYRLVPDAGRFLLEDFARPAGPARASVCAHGRRLRRGARRLAGPALPAWHAVQPAGTRLPGHQPAAVPSLSVGA